MTTITLDVGPINRIRAIETDLAALEADLTSLSGSTVTAQGLLVKSGTLGGGLVLNVPKANPFEVIAYNDTKAVTAAGIKPLIDAVANAVVSGAGLATGSGPVGGGVTINVPKANAFEFNAYNDTKAVTSLVVKTETDQKLNRAAKASPAEAIAGADIEKWVNPFALKQAINARIVEVAASENPDLDAIQEQIEDRMEPAFGNAVFDPTGATGAARANLSNVVPTVGRASLGMPKIRSLAEVGPKATNALYTDAVEALLQEAADDGDVAYVPPGSGNGRISRPMVVSGMLSIFGWAGLSNILTTGFNAPVLTIDVTEQVVLPIHRIGGFTIYNDIGSTANNLSAGIAFTGSEFLTYVHFSHLYSVGCYATIKNMMDTFPSAFGEESYLNNCTFDNIWTFYHPGAINAKYGVWMTNGSGTGNDYRNFKGNLARSGTATGDIAVQPANLRVDGGPGVVAGDILCDGTITALGTSMISVDGSMNYLNAIRVGPMAQIDAQSVGSIRFDPMPTGDTYGLASEAVVGGETDLSAQYGRVQGSIIRHQGVGEQMAGVARQSIASGGVDVQIGVVSMSQYSGGVVEISASGLVQGVGGGTARKVFLLSSTDTTAAATVAEDHVSPPAFGGIAIGASISGLTVTFFATVTGISNGSKIDGQIVVRGGQCKLKRGSL